ncbi:MAG: pyruvate kinase alpha/beta domain-containing protein [Armatimonadota bacterium]
MRKSIVYFDQPGPVNTDECIAAAVERAEELGLRHLVIASSTGDTAEKLKAAVGERDLKVVCVTYHAGMKGEDQVMAVERREELRAQGIEVVICSHALSGVERSINNKFGTIGPVEIMAHTFRCFGQGVKVAVEVAVMAADSGLAPTTEDIICLGGSGKGCDVAVVLRAAHQNNFFDLRVREIVAMVRA